MTVAELASNATPVVAVAAGSVTDKAGNALVAAATQMAKDGLPAVLTVTTTGTGDRPVAKDTVTITIVSDERLTGAPSVVINKVLADYELKDSVVGSESVVVKQSGSAAPTGTLNQWSFKSSSAFKSGLYNIHVSGTDRGSGIKSSEGKSSLSADTLSSAITFEIDEKVAAPKFTPDNKGETDNPNVFITASYAAEGREYTILVDNNTPPTAADSSDDTLTDLDSHGTVTLTSATLDGADVTSMVSTRDNILFVYRPGNLSLGSHKLELKVTDAAGNPGTHSTTFDVTARKPFVLSVSPGANLVSFPANPVDGSIGAVFGSHSEITTVVTYDNATGLWMTAIRGSDGNFTGDLTTIDAMHGYWVVSDGSVSVSVMLPAAGGLTVTPPAIPVVKGWNLVPIADVAQGKGTDKGMFDAGKYFANIDADVAYGYNSAMGTMNRIDAKSVTTKDGPTPDKVSVGKAYWVYANAAGVIIP